MRPTSLHATAVTLASICAALAARANANEPAQLVHGPLSAASPRVFDLRTPYPHALVLIFRSNASGPFVPIDPAWPTLGVAHGTTPFARATDAQGRLRLVLPATGVSPQPGRSAFQALVRAPDGRWDASNPVAVRREATVPASPWLIEDHAPPLPASAATLAAHAVVAEDLDHDGDRDLLLAHGLGLALWLDQGAAGYVDTGSTRLAQPTVPVSCIATADVDRDGDFDVYAGGTLDSGNIWPDRLWRNDGTASFTADAAFPPGDGATACAEFGDVDGDADADLLIAHGGDGHGQLVSPCRLLRNTAGAFASDAAFVGAAWNQGNAPCPAARFGDVDDDGDLDVFVARSDISGTHQGFGEPNVLLINDGTGVFTDESAARFSLVLSDNSLDAQFVDVDLDGDLDVAVANSVGGVTTAQSGDLWINQGGLQGGVPGFFVDDSTSPLESTSYLYRVRLGITVGDVDTDGDPDLLLPVHDLPPGSQPMLLLNQGGAQHGALGRFELATWFMPGAFVASGALFFDRDCDGDVELVLPASGTLTGDVPTSLRVLWIEATLP